MRIKNLKSGFEKLIPAKARLIAHLIGDGCVYRSKTDYNIKYDNTDSELIEQYRNDLRDIYGFITKIEYKQSGKTKKVTPYVRVRSKRAYDDLKKYCEFRSLGWRVPKNISKATPTIQKEFLSALYDDEGSVVPEGKHGIIRLYSINLKGLEQIQKILEKFKIKSKITAGFGFKRNVYALVVRDIKQFHKTIRFYCTRKQRRLVEFVKKEEE